MDLAAFPSAFLSSASTIPCKRVGNKNTGNPYAEWIDGHWRFRWIDHDEQREKETACETDLNRANVAKNISLVMIFPVKMILDCMSRRDFGDCYTFSP